MNTDPIYVFAKWQVKEGQLNTVLSLLTEVAQKSQEEEGNLFYKVHQVITDANTLVLFEGYADEAALEKHRNSAHFKTLVIGEIISKLENREVLLTAQVSFD